jgi:DNA modification methylase
MNKILFGDCIQSLQTLPEKFVHTCVTSPPYFGLRDYGHDGQIGLEPTPDEYVAKLVAVFREVRRVLRDDGTLWLNLGDSYAANRSYQVASTKGGAKHSDSRSVGGKGSVVPDGLKPKDLIGIPWRVAFALQADGWFLRQDIIWAKPNPMPESVTDRCTKSHEYIFWLSKSEKYYFDHEIVKEPVAASSVSRLNQDLERQIGSIRVPGKTNGNMKAVGNGETRNRRSVWTVSTKPYKGAHFATFPPDLITPCVLAGCRPDGVVLDPFMGSGTTAAVAISHGRQYVGCELNPEYGPLQEERIQKEVVKLFADMI